MQNVTNNMASAVVSSAINGKPLNEETLSTALSSALITAGMAQAANNIGAATQNGTLNAYTQALAHALAGCVGGAATTGNSGGCSAGAVGAVVGELTMKFATDSQMTGSNALKLAASMSAVAGALVGGPNSAAAVNVASQMGTNAALNNYLSHVKPSLMELSEVEKYNRAVADCGPSNQAACALRDELASLSAQRDRSLALACNGQTPDLCGSLARHAVAMGNLVRTTEGGYVYANSPQSGAIQGLNTATVGSTSRPENFHDQASASTAQGLAFIGGGLAADSTLTVAVNGGMKTFEAYKTAQQAYNLGASAATGATTAVITYTASEAVKSIPVAVNNQSASDGVNNFLTNWNAQEATNSAFWGAIGGVGTTQMFKWSGVANESIFKQLANPSASVIVIRANSSAINQVGKAATAAIVDQPSKK
jgi:hypothetical protein